MKPFLTKFRFQRILIGLFLIVLSILTINWIYGHGRIAVSTPSNTEATITFINSDNGKSYTSKTTSERTSKILPSGDYRVTVNNSSFSSVSFVESPRLLKINTTNPKLKKQKNREFIGNVPAPCSFYISDILYSYECSNNSGKIYKHVPATKNTPTYIQTLDLFNGQEILSSISTSEGTILLLGPIYYSEETVEKNYSLIKFTNSLQPNASREITNLPLDSNYKLLPYKTGFIIYRTDYSTLDYYSSFDSSPKFLDSGVNTIGGLNPRSIVQSSSSVVVSYTKQSPSENTISAEIEKNTSKVIIISDDKNNTVIDVQGTVAKAVLCGDNKLCVLFTNKAMTVFSTRGKTLEPLYSLTEIDDLFSDQGQITLQNKTGLLALNTDERTGFYLYTYGQYRACGISELLDTYLLCVIDKRHNKSALLLSKNTEASYLIDQRISVFINSPKIEGISSYRSYIFVTPKTGNTSLDTYLKEYSQAEIEISRLVIKSLVKESGLDKSQITVINTVESN